MNGSKHYFDVILIENDRATADLYYRLLNETYHVIICENENQVMENVRANQVKAIVIEPVLRTGMSWNFLSNILKISNENIKIPVIVCSSLDSRKQGLEMGATEYLVKPVLPSTLLKVLQREIG